MATNGVPGRSGYPRRAAPGRQAAPPRIARRHAACRPTTPATARFVWGRARPQLQARDHLFELHLPDRPNRRLHGAGPRLRPTRLRESRVAEPRAFRAQEQEWRREALALSAEE